MSKYVSVDRFSYRYKNLELAASNHIEKRDLDPTEWGIRKDERAHVQYDLTVFPGIEIVRCKNCLNRSTDECPMYYVEWHSYEEDGWIESNDIVNDYTEDDGFCYLGREIINE